MSEHNQTFNHEELSEGIDQKQEIIKPKVNDFISTLLSNFDLIHRDDHNVVIHNKVTNQYIITDLDGTTFIKDISFCRKDSKALTSESLISILVHRLEILNKGDYPCQENTLAIEGLKAAKIALENRMRKLRRFKSVDPDASIIKLNLNSDKPIEIINK